MANQVATTQQERVPQTVAGAMPQTGVVYRPATDIYEDDGHLYVEADLPGVSPEDIDITLERQVLTIRGDAKITRPEGYRLIYSEYGEGSYERSFMISANIDRDQIDAEQKNGILTLRLPKAETARTKRVEVKAS